MSRNPSNKPSRLFTTRHRTSFSRRVARHPLSKIHWVGRSPLRRMTPGERAAARVAAMIEAVKGGKSTLVTLATVTRYMQLTAPSFERFRKTRIDFKPCGNFFIAQEVKVPQP